MPTCIEVHQFWIARLRVDNLILGQVTKKPHPQRSPGLCRSSFPRSRCCRGSWQSPPQRSWVAATRRSLEPRSLHRSSPSSPWTVFNGHYRAFTAKFRCAKDVYFTSFLDGCLFTFSLGSIKRNCKLSQIVISNDLQFLYFFVLLFFIPVRYGLFFIPDTINP